jgi:hypothetical protein
VLAPETRTLLTEALRPPEGFRLDVAVATTYSLDLHALLLAPLSFALYEVSGDELDTIDPIKLLEAVRRYAGRITVFCQAGAIHVPSSYRRILTFAEDSVRQVLPPDRGRVFHPKIWVLRFTDTSGRRLHRFLCLSRNLTFDKSWDTLVRLEEGESADAPDCVPLADFVARLPELGVTSLDTGRANDIASLAESVRQARFDLPAGFTDLSFLPMGIGPEPVWPFPPQVDRLLAISAFLDPTTLARLTGSAHESIVVSRQESLDQAQPGTARLFTLQRGAEVEAGTDAPAAVRRLEESGDIPEGLHAKTFFAEVGDHAMVVTGSANATTAGFGGNVEFDVVMRGPRDVCGVTETWDGSDGESPGLSRLCEPYTPTPVPTDEQATAAAERAIDRFHAELAAAPLELRAERLDDGRFALGLAPVPLTGPGTTRVWPLSLPGDIDAKPLDPAPRWAPIAVESITPFVVVETVDDVRKVTRTTVLKAVLRGDPPERRVDALRDMLKDKEGVLRYLVFLLGDPADESWLGAGGESAAQWGLGTTGHAGGHLVLFEPLVRAVAAGDDAVQRVAGLVKEIRGLKDGGDLLPDGFEELWSAVWAAYSGEAT